MSQQQKVESRAKDAESAPVDEVPTQDQTKSEKLKADIDAILDEIDECLVDNAQQFVKEYVQRGGQ